LNAFKSIHNNQWFKYIAYFFPIQLVFVQLKKNQLLLLFWIVLFGMITKSVAVRYGAPYLFLNPEYMNETNVLSYFVVGFACGGFIMAFNISSYIMNGFRFPFLATVSNPFLKFCLNNCIVPILFMVVYCLEIYKFQYQDQYTSHLKIWLDILGFIGGNVLFIFLSLSYFFKFNKDIFNLFGIKTVEQEDLKKLKTARVVFRKNMSMKNISGKESRDWHVETYISNFTRIRIARDVSHYDKENLLEVFRQNHRNAAVFEIFVVITVLLLGLFRNVPILAFPAGASLFLIFTLYLMITSALHAWLRGWSTFVTLVIFLCINYLFSLDMFYAKSYAFGLNYNTEKASYSDENLSRYNAANVDSDIQHMISILEKWKTKNSSTEIDKKYKPKLVLVNTSGGGLRSSLWTFEVLQFTDNILHDELLNHTFMITGASGGMVGAAYLRELYLKKVKDKKFNFHDSRYRENISRDILNPIAFSIAVNDLFLRFQTFKDGEYVYKMDRGYAFETGLNHNTGDIFKNKRLRDYKQLESEAKIPLMVFTPTVVNDGRKMYISSQPVSFLTQTNHAENLDIQLNTEGVEFSSFFKKQDADNLLFTSALRMNATFPYVTPVVDVPSVPVIELMDAGARDNYGVQTTMKFIYTFRKWIEENTSGVVIIQIRDRFKQFPIEANGNKNLVGTLSTPMDAFYSNTFTIQDFGNDEIYKYGSKWLNCKVDVIDFQLHNLKSDNISLSWHLTNKEKRKVLSSLALPENQAAMLKLKNILDPNLVK
jgi:hypothetical protein